MKNIKYVAWILILGVTLAGCTNTITNQETISTQSEGANVGESTAGGGEKMKKMTIYSQEEVALHNSQDDCWLVIEGKVYDVSSYIAGQKHPGGAAILQGCGMDATELFNNRPNDKGPHSEKAKSFLADFLIGELEQL